MLNYWYIWTWFKHEVVFHQGGFSREGLLYFNKIINSPTFFHKRNKTKRTLAPAYYYFFKIHSWTTSRLLSSGRNECNSV